MEPRCPAGGDPNDRLSYLFRGRTLGELMRASPGQRNQVTWTARDRVLCRQFLAHHKMDISRIRGLDLRDLADTLSIDQELSENEWAAIKSKLQASLKNTLQTALKAGQLVDKWDAVLNKRTIEWPERVRNEWLRPVELANAQDAPGTPPPRRPDPAVPPTPPADDGVSWVPLPADQLSPRANLARLRGQRSSQRGSELPPSPTSSPDRRPQAEGVVPNAPRSRVEGGDLGLDRMLSDLVGSNRELRDIERRGDDLCSRLGRLALSSPEEVAYDSWSAIFRWQRGITAAAGSRQGANGGVGELDTLGRRRRAQRAVSAAAAEVVLSRVKSIGDGWDVPNLDRLLWWLPM